MWLNFEKAHFMNMNDITDISCSGCSEKTYRGDTTFYLTVEFAKNCDVILTLCFEDSEEGFTNRQNFLNDFYDALNFKSNVLTVDYDRYGIIKRD